MASQHIGHMCERRTDTTIFNVIVRDHELTQMERVLQRLRQIERLGNNPPTDVSARAAHHVDASRVRVFATGTAMGYWSARAWQTPCSPILFFQRLRLRRLNAKRQVNQQRVRAIVLR